MPTHRFLTVLAPALGLVLVSPAGAAAHALGVEARLAGGRVTVEAFFDDNTPAVGAKVAVAREDGTPATAGETDERGAWSFPAPPPGRYVLTVDAGAGHRAKTAVVIPPPDEPTPPTGPARIVSEGPTRAAATGPWRWLAAAAGLAVIGLVTLAARQLARSRRERNVTDGDSRRSGCA